MAQGRKVTEITLDLSSSMQKIARLSFPKATQVIEQKSCLIVSSKSKSTALPKLALWYNKVEEAGFESFKVVSDTVLANYSDILNFFNNKSTNASAESFNSKIKAFRAQLRGITDEPLYMSPFHIATASPLSLPFISPDVNFQPIGANFQPEVANFLPEVAKVNKFLGRFGVFSGFSETKKGENKDLFYFRGFRGAAIILFCGGRGVHWV